MARSLTPDWPRRAVAVLAAAISLAWATPFAQVAIIAGGAVIGRFLLAPPATQPTGPEPSYRRKPNAGAAPANRA